VAIDVSVFRLVSGDKDRPSLYYNLYVANLEDAYLEYIVEYWHRASFDEVHVTPGRFRDVQATSSPEAGLFVATNRFRLLPRETTVVTLRFAGVEPSSVDLSGYVRLRFPRVNLPGAQQGVRLVPQSDGVLKVMLHAETVTDVEPSIRERGGISDSRGFAIAHFGVSGALSNVRTAVGLTLASGRAVNEITPDGNFVINKSLLGLVNKVARDTDPALPGKGATSDVADEDRATALLELLAELSSDPETIQEVNRLLQRSRVMIRLAASESPESSEN
jgi:hypothetical protein